MNQIIDWLNQNNGASQVILALALVLVTIWYTFLTRRSVKILEKQIMTGIRPVVAVEVFHVPEDPNDEGSYCIHSKLINIGAGVAIDINVEFVDAETKLLIGRSLNSIDFIRPDGYQSTHHIHLTKDSLKKIRYTQTHHGMSAELLCLVSFTDTHGNLIKTQQKVYFIQAKREIFAEPGTFKIIDTSL